MNKEIIEVLIDAGVPLNSNCTETEKYQAAMHLYRILKDSPDLADRRRKVNKTDTEYHWLIKTENLLDDYFVGKQSGNMLNEITLYLHRALDIVNCTVQ